MIEVINPSSGGTTGIPEYTSDPVSPSAQDAWVRRSGSAGGQVTLFIGGFPYTDPGSGYTYEFRYRTTEGTTIGVPLT